MSSFNDLKLSDAVLKAIASMGFEEATSIQEQAIPLALKGQDIIGQAQTGTGKTAAFGIPMVEKLDNKSGEIQGIVITPTRELAIQVAEEINRIGQPSGIHALPIYGGQDYRWQMQGLRNKPQIIVGTPGRLVDHITLRKTIKVDHVTDAGPGRGGRDARHGLHRRHRDDTFKDAERAPDTVVLRDHVRAHQETGHAFHERPGVCRQHVKENDRSADRAILCRGPGIGQVRGPVQDTGPAVLRRSPSSSAGQKSAWTSCREH